jgi:hypothetical protein
MPTTKVVLFREDDGGVPILDWLDGLPPKGRVKCRARIERLREMGHELRRPEADYLRDGIYELRTSLQGVQYGYSISFTDELRPSFLTES